eukprot:TRINITY_DN26057_c0_g4_i1.p1 TRINITY_DN26057_c0_g4~~TRINITY_DN26057_c0_g4_i1.p1  ORF type:complete len:422 (-),score=78.09 TRINITY_DN26057_c0_g4_i1:165-1430(-)
MSLQDGSQLAADAAIPNVDPVKLAPLLAGQRVLGVIRSYSHATGFGFIVCRETSERLGRDVFIQRVEAEPIGATVGATVSFTVEINKDGKPKAKNVKLEAPGVKRATPGERNAENTVNEIISQMTTQVLEKVYVGTIKSFSQSTGFGFITCDETFALFGRDCFLHQSNVNGFGVGDQVAFRVNLDLDKATPQARDLKAPADAELVETEYGSCGVSMLGMMGLMSMMGIPMTMLGQMMGQFPNLIPAPAAAPIADGNALNAAGISNAEWIRERDQESGLNQERGGKLALLQKLVDKKHRFVGIIRTFNRARGFGFIGCDETQQISGSDVFLHNEQREDFEVGDVISFAIEIRSNQARAKDLRRSTGPSDRGEQSPPRYQDKDRRANAERYPLTRGGDSGRGGRSRTRSRSRSHHRRRPPRRR